MRSRPRARLQEAGLSLQWQASRWAIRGTHLTYQWWHVAATHAQARWHATQNWANAAWRLLTWGDHT